MKVCSIFVDVANLTLQVLLFFCVCFTSVLAENVVSYDLAGKIGPAWNSDGSGFSSNEHYYADQPTDFYSLPARYGFRVYGTWSPYRGSPSGFFPPSYVPASTLWLRLCSLVPVKNENYNLVVQAFSGSGCSTSGLSSTFEWSIEALQADGVTTTRVVAPSVGGSPRISRAVFNVTALKLANPGGLFLRLKNLRGAPERFEFRFMRQDVTAWNDINTCSYPTFSNLVHAPCSPFVGPIGGKCLVLECPFSLFLACTDNAYDPTVEDCDYAMDPTNCSPSCTCRIPFVPDGVGKCTSCGNGAIEAAYSEVCDRKNDKNCAADCKACATGFVAGPTGVCTKCGNGVADSEEVCDNKLDFHCSATCQCAAGFVGDGRGGCTTCGNGKLDAGEFCDNGSPHCNTECTGCAISPTGTPYVVHPLDPTGACTLCGNKVLDADEACDFGSDYACNYNCEGCSPFHKAVGGVCTRCGNGYLDAGEVCDGLREGCAQDCQSCNDGMVPSGDKWGACGRCGNGIVEPDEVCDTALDASCSPDCGSCVHPFTSVNRRCVRCGNGRLDTYLDADGQILFVEVCDAAQPGCKSDCTGCEAGWVSDSTSPTGTCIPECDACCAELRELTGETPEEVASAGALAVSFALLSGLLATLF